MTLEQDLLGKIESHEAHVGIIGLGYVGLPLAVAFGEAGFPTLGFDVNPSVVNGIQAAIPKLNRNDRVISLILPCPQFNFKSNSFRHHGGGEACAEYAWIYVSPRRGNRGRPCEGQR